MADSTADDQISDNLFNRPGRWIRNLFSEYFLFSEQNPLFYWMFRTRMRPISIRRIQVLLSFSAFLIVLFWPEDFILKKSPELRTALAYWRTLTVIASLGGIAGLQYSSFLKKNTALFFTTLISLDMLLAGYLIGSVKGPDYPWFDFLVFLIPMFSIVLSVPFVMRLLAAFCMSLSYVMPYVLVSPEHLQFQYFLHFLPLWFTVVVLTTVIGHSIYYFDFLTYVKERELQLKQQEIERLARYDQLTSLLNRSELNRQASKAIDEANRYDNNLAVALIDLDHFKKVNDTYGHQAGDKVLSEIGEMIQENVRKADIAGRYGGEEFCVVMPQTSLDGAQKLVERIRKTLAKKTFRTDEGGEISITCSVGLTSRSNRETSLEQLLKEADEGLYEAKDSGRNRTVCVQ